MSLPFCLRLCFTSLALLTSTMAQEATPQFFPGADSDISSVDSERAEKAVIKWTKRGGTQDGQSLSQAPYYWDRSKVGRPVFIRIMKNDNQHGRLELWTEDASTKKFELLKTYQIAYFSGELGPKTKTGDLQAPEGFYYISRSRMNPHSSYHLSMDMGYPNSYDKEKGYTGSHLMIHGSSVSLGCFAMSDCSIEQIYTMVDQALVNGQKIIRVHSFPFAMTDANMTRAANHPQYAFWKNLKEGWDWFEKNRTPPNVEVKEGKYTFESDQ